MNKSLYQQEIQRALSCQLTGKSQQALDILKQLLPQSDEPIPILFHLANIYGQLQQWQKSSQILLNILLLQPDNKNAMNELLLLLKSKKLASLPSEKVNQILDFFESQAQSELSPEALCQLSRLYIHDKSFTRAGLTCQKSLKKNSTHIESLELLAYILLEQGFSERSIKLYKTLLKQLPQNLSKKRQSIHSSLLIAMRSSPDLAKSTVFNEHLIWANNYCQSPVEVRFTNEMKPEKKLNIGYISNNFKNHSSSFVSLPLFEHHNKERFKIYAYSGLSFPDDVTKIYENHSDQWISIAEKSNQEIRKRIINDKIDILVDFDSHLTSQRMNIFSEKCAPVQMTGLGFSQTSGQNQMDYIFSDRDIIPPSNVKFYSEKVVYTQSLIRWKAPQKQVTISQPPFIKNNLITFGCGNQLYKYNRAVIEAWSSILKGTPNSRLFLKTTGFDDPLTCEMYSNMFEQMGVSSERVFFFGNTTTDAHMAFYHLIDIALDPFPYNGGITLCECSWAGVPTIALKGGVGSSASLLSTIGLSICLASTPEEYVEKAIQLAQQPARILQIRKTLARQLVHSPICDPIAFTREIEHAYRILWRRWCVKNET